MGPKNVITSHLLYQTVFYKVLVKLNFQGGAGTSRSMVDQVYLLYIRSSLKHWGDTMEFRGQRHGQSKAGGGESGGMPPLVIFFISVPKCCNFRSNILPSAIKMERQMSCCSPPPELLLFAIVH